MNATEELEERCALTRSRKLGGLTPAGFEELRRDVHENLSELHRDRRPEGPEYPQRRPCPL
jgi:hypothetical protein